MRADLRLVKAYKRMDARGFQYEKHWEWMLSKPQRLSVRYVNRCGKNRDYIHADFAGYIGRKRQIEKCFMKGWC